MELKPVKSSSVEAIGYDVMKQQLHVKFKKGGTYTYHDVPERVHDELIRAKSIGEHMAKVIVGKGKYKFTKSKATR